jgi:hypothetical protein
MSLPLASRGAAGSASISLNARGCGLLTTREKKNFSYLKISFVSERIRLGISKRVVFGIDNPQLNALAFEFISDLAKTQRRARQPVEPGDDQRVFPANVFETGFELRTLSRRRASLFLKDLFAVFEFIELRFRTLTDRADADVTDLCHKFKMDNDKYKKLKLADSIIHFSRSCIK